MYFWCFGFRGELGFLNCDDVCMCVVNKQFELLEFVSESVYVDLQYDEISLTFTAGPVCLFHLAHQCLLLIPMYTIVPSLDIINPSEYVLDLGITMSRNCSFDVHINILCKKCTDSSGWILRIFTSRDSTTLMTLFNALILSRLDYCSQLWSPHLIKHIIQIEINVPLLNSKLGCVIVVTVIDSLC